MFDRRAASYGAAIGLLVVHAAICSIEAAHSSRPLPDFVRYYEIASAPGRPYVDYQVEHPPGTLAVFKALAALSNDRAAFAAKLVTLNGVADAAIVAALWTTWGTAAAIFYLAASWPMLAIVVDRVDLLSTACAVLAVAAWTRRRSAIAGVAIAAGVGFKLWPLPFVALLAADGDRRRRRDGVLAFAGGAAALAAVWVAVAGFTGLWEVLTFRGATGWQIESTVGSVLRLFGDATVRLEAGAWRIGSIPRGASIALFTVAAPLTLAALYAGARTRLIGAAWIAAVSALLLCSALFSAQYVIWLVPGAAIAWCEDERAAAMLVAVAVLATGIFMRNYFALLAGAPAVVWLVIGRNAILAGAAAIAARPLARAAFRARRESVPPTSSGRRAMDVRRG